VTRTRSILLVITALIIAAVCIRLGMWQLDRLDQRRAENARVAAGIAGAPIPMDAIGGDSSQSRAQRVELRGTYDFDHEIALINRSRDGAPGVNILTPLKLAGRDTAVMVNRGWVYSPDGATIDLTQWREPTGATGTAYVSWLQGASGSADAAGTSGASNATPVTNRATAITAAEASESSGTVAQTQIAARRRVMRLDHRAIAALMPYPIAPYQLILIEEGATAGSRGAGYGDASPSPFGTAVVDSTRPIRIPLPALDEGPHKSYAVQWFAFAAIALVGTAAVVGKDRFRREPESPL
jgi:surfeit locus 1 family protein